MKAELRIDLKEFFFLLFAMISKRFHALEKESIFKHFFFLQKMFEHSEWNEKKKSECIFSMVPTSTAHQSQLKSKRMINNTSLFQHKKVHSNACGHFFISFFVKSA